MRTASREQCREIDRRAMSEFGVPGVVLMENAGRGVAERLLELGVAGPVVICCGKGNNGGDGLVIARHLDLRGVPVRVLMCAAPREAEPAAGESPVDNSLAGAAAINRRIVERSGLPLLDYRVVLSGPGGATPDRSTAAEPLRWLAEAEWIVDALLGTGAQGPPRPPLDQVIDLINVQPARKLAVDLPSGLDADSGTPAAHTVCADETCTFVAHKPGFLIPGADRYTGRIHVIGIGAPATLLNDVLGPA